MLEEVNGLLCAADACPEVSVGTDHSVASFEQRGISLTLNQKIDGPAGIVVNEKFVGPAGINVIGPAGTTEGSNAEFARPATQGELAPQDAASKLLYTKAIPTALLVTPVKKAGGSMVEIGSQTKRKSTRLASKPRSGLTMEQQATALLLKKCGAADDAAGPAHVAQTTLATKFVAPIVKDTVSNYRDLFGLPEGDGADKFAAITIDAEA